MRFWQCLTASLLSRSRELPHQLEENTKHLHFTPSRSHTQPVLSFPSCPLSQQWWGWGSEPYLIWPALPLAGSPSLLPSHWQWPRDGQEELGTVGYSNKQKPCIGSRRRERNNKRLKTTYVRRCVTLDQLYKSLDWTTEHRAAKQPNRSWDCSCDGHGCPLLSLLSGFSSPCRNDNNIRTIMSRMQYS